MPIGVVAKCLYLRCYVNSFNVGVRLGWGGYMRGIFVGLYFVGFRLVIVRSALVHGVY